VQKTIREELESGIKAQVLAQVHADACAAAREEAGIHGLELRKQVVGLVESLEACKHSATVSSLMAATASAVSKCQDQMQENHGGGKALQHLGNSMLGLESEVKHLLNTSLESHAELKNENAQVQHDLNALRSQLQKLACSDLPQIWEKLRQPPEQLRHPVRLKAVQHGTMERVSSAAALPTSTAMPQMCLAMLPTPARSPTRPGKALSPNASRARLKGQHSFTDYCQFPAGSPQPSRQQSRGSRPLAGAVLTDVCRSRVRSLEPGRQHSQGSRPLASSLEPTRQQSRGGRSLVGSPGPSRRRTRRPTPAAVCSSSHSSSRGQQSQGSRSRSPSSSPAPSRQQSRGLIGSPGPSRQASVTRRASSPPAGTGTQARLPEAAAAPQVQIVTVADVVAAPQSRNSSYVPAAQVRNSTPTRSGTPTPVPAPSNVQAQHPTPTRSGTASPVAPVQVQHATPTTSGTTSPIVPVQVRHPTPTMRCHL
jgi:hypothetical protein